MTNEDNMEPQEEYQPKDDEIKSQLNKFQKINNDIFKETHKEEYKKK